MPDHVKKKCACGKDYYTHVNNVARGWGKSCSKSCAAIRREEAKSKLRAQKRDQKVRKKPKGMTKKDWQEWVAKVHGSDLSNGKDPSDSCMSQRFGVKIDLDSGGLA